MTEKPIAATWSALQLPAMPTFLCLMLNKAQLELDVHKVILFGSRARGDNTPTSDYDLCFVLRSNGGWPEFVVDVKETAATLCALDLVNYNEINAKLRQEIDQIGVVLHVNNKNQNCL